MIIYGFVVSNIFYSENMKAKLKKPKANGLYQLDLNNPLYIEGIEYADIIKFHKYMKKSKKIVSLTGFTFHDGFIPLDYIKWMKKGYSSPIKLLNPESCDEWQVIRVYYLLKHRVFIFGEWLLNPLQASLFLVKDNFKVEMRIDYLKTITPEMRLLYSFHAIEKIKQAEELARLKAEEYKRTLQGRLETIIKDAGGKFIKHKVFNDGSIRVIWECVGEKIMTLLDKNFRVQNVGFCVTGWDDTQSMGSAVNLLQQYKEDGDPIHKTYVED